MAAEGIKLYGVSYDDAEALAAYVEGSGVEFTLLSDVDSAVIRQYEVLNTIVQPDLGTTTRPSRHRLGTPRAEPTGHCFHRSASQPSIVQSDVRHIHSSHHTSPGRRRNGHRRVNESANLCGHNHSAGTDSPTAPGQTDIYESPKVGDSQNSAASLAEISRVLRSPMSFSGTPENCPVKTHAGRRAISEVRSGS